MRSEKDAAVDMTDDIELAFLLSTLAPMWADHTAADDLAKASQNPIGNYNLSDGW